MARARRRSHPTLGVALDPPEDPVLLTGGDGESCKRVRGASVAESDSMVDLMSVGLRSRIEGCVRRRGAEMMPLVLALARFLCWWEVVKIRVLSGILY